MNRQAVIMDRMKVLAGCLALLFFAASSACGSSKSPVPQSVVPQSVGALKLEQVKSGEEARAEINKLHGKQLSFLQGYIATYRGEKSEATLWVSTFESEKAGEEELAKMTGKLKGSTGTGFQHFQTLTMEGIPVYMVTGMGQVHYFFRKGKQGFWLAVAPSEAREAIRDLVKKLP